ncbi:YbaB/EbfC family nucleoid-associated protein [Flindersiella endophytica]
MSSGTDPVSGLLQELARVNGAGEAANGLVRVEVDGTGDITGLVIAPKAMRLASEDLSDAVLLAFGQARSAVQEQLATNPPRSVGGAEDTRDNVRATLDEISSGAQRTLSELTATVDGLSRRLDRQ